jgi:murein DD-endopeptidase MepM/ murein hydrolase activator NlpD
MMRAVLCVLWLMTTTAGACPIAATPPLLSPPAAGEIISGFGPRTHPILQMLKFHPGVDYSAMLGDPIRAAAAGVVTVAGRKGAYGN